MSFIEEKSVVTVDRTLASWTGEFGNEYIARNGWTDETRRRTILKWSRVLTPLQGRALGSCCEVGCNIGLNLRVLKEITDMELFGLEPNALARQQILTDGVLPTDHLFPNAGHENPLENCAIDLVFTSGVLIHVHPDRLRQTMDEVVRVSRKYVLCMEYFSPTPEQKTYRGQEGLLYKNDFGGLYMDHYPDLMLMDYGFFWKRATGLDNFTWWLFEKNAS